MLSHFPDPDHASEGRRDRHVEKISKYDVLQLHSASHKEVIIGTQKGVSVGGQKNVVQSIHGREEI